MPDNVQPDWLIRDTNNIIRGPYTRGEVLQLLKKGQIKGKTEVCRSSSYWFSLEELSELEKFFPEITEVNTKSLRHEPTGTMTNAGEPHATEGEGEATQVISARTEDTPAGQWLDSSAAMDFGEEPPAVSAPTFIKPKRENAPKPAPVRQTPETSEPKRKRNILKYLAIGFAAVLLLAALLLFLKQDEPVQSVPSTKKVSNKAPKLPTQQQLLRAFLIRDTDEIKRAVLQLERENPNTPKAAIAQAILRRWYLFDLDGAIAALEEIRAKASEERPVVENLLGVLFAERDTNRAAGYLTSALAGGGPVTAYNFAIVQIRNGNLPLAESALGDWEKKVPSGTPAYSDLALASLWLADRKTLSASSSPYKILARDLVDPKFRAIRGLMNLRRNQISAAEDEFRAFVELLPEFDPGAAKDVRKLGDEAFYEYVWKQAQELHGLTTSRNSRLSPVIVAGIGVLTAIQNRNDEAGKILDNALNGAPGNPTLLKALAYVRWREGRFREMIDLLQSLSADSRDDFSVIYLLARANSRLGNHGSAETNFTQVVKIMPTRSDGWSGYGETLVALNKKAEAMKAFDEALKLDRLDVTAIRGLDQLQDRSFLERPEYKSFFPVF